MFESHENYRSLISNEKVCDIQGLKILKCGGKN